MRGLAVVVMSVWVGWHFISAQQNLTVPLGWYSAEELAQALSTPQRTVSVHPALSQRVFLIHLRDRPFEQVCQLLQQGTGVRVTPTGERRWRLEWDPSVELRERRWRQRLAQALDKQVAAQLQEVLRTVPLLSPEAARALKQTVATLNNSLDATPAGEESEAFFDGHYKRLLALKLDTLALAPDVIAWARQVAQMPKGFAPTLYMERPESFSPQEVSELMFRDVLSDAIHNGLTYQGMIAVALMYQEPSWRVSAQEALEQGLSVRAVPLVRLIERFPQLQGLKSICINHPTLTEGDAPEEAERNFENLWLIVRLTIAYKPVLSFDIVGRDRSASLGLPVRIPSTELEFSERSRWEVIRSMFRAVGREGEKFVEQAYRATEEALKDPKLTAEIEVGNEPLGVWSRWVYRWAQATQSEVVMLLCPGDDPIFQEPVGGKTTLAHLYQKRDRVALYFGLDMHAWALQFNEGVLLVNNLSLFIHRPYEYPAASLKALMERWDKLTYDDLRTYYRSVTPQQNRWWFWRTRQWMVAPFRALEGSPSRAVSSRYSWGNLWFSIALLESLSEARRTQILTVGHGAVNLEDIPEPARRQMMEWIRLSMMNELLGLSAYHPHRALNAVHWRFGRQSNTVARYRLEYQRTGAIEVQLVLRSIGGLSADPEGVFNSNEWDDFSERESTEE